MTDEPRGRVRVFSDAQLREDLEADLRPSEIAAKHGVSRQAVYQRIERLNETTLAAATAPEESRRFVRTQLDAMELLVSRCLRPAELLQDACERYLAEADEEGHPTGRYDVGPRASEVMVTCLRMVDGKPQTFRKPLDQLLALVDGADGIGMVQHFESKHADPRELILGTVRECRATIDSCVQLSERLAQFEKLQHLQQLLLSALQRVEPDTARQIAEELRCGLLLGATPGGSCALAAGGE